MKRAFPIILLVVCVTILVYFFLSFKRNYSWNPTFLHDSEEPFGCKLFDKMAEATMPQGYSYYDGNPEEILDSKGGKALLIVYDGYRNWNIEKMERLTDFVKRGNKLLLVSNDFMITGDEDDYSHYYDFYHHLSVQNYGSFDVRDYMESLKDTSAYRIVRWLSPEGDTLRIKKDFLTHCFVGMPVEHTVTAKLALDITKNSEYDDYPVSPYGYDGDRPLYEGEEEVPDSLDAETPNPDTIDPYGTNADKDTYREKTRTVVSVGTKIGDGYLYADCNPLIFTNYGTLHPEMARYQHYAMSQIADCEVIRMPANLFLKFEDGSDSYRQSPLTFFLSQPSLRWALFTLLAAIVIGMFFTARRRQRIIPVIKRPENRNLGFVKIIGSIYYHRRDRVDLLWKKYTYFKEELRRKQLIDIDDKASDTQNFAILSQLTGMEEKAIADKISLLRFMLAMEGDIEFEEMQTSIDDMNEILQKLNSQFIIDNS